MKDAIRSLALENEKQDQLLLQYDEETKKLNDEKQIVEVKKSERNLEYELKRTQIMELEKECDDILIKHESAGEHLAIQEAEKVRLSLHYQTIVHKTRRDHEYLIKSIRDKENGLKNERRLDTFVNNIKRSIPVVLHQQDDLKQAIVFIDREEKDLLSQLSKIKTEIDLASYEYVNQDQVEKYEQENVENLILSNKKLEDECAEISQNITDLSRKIDEMNTDRAVRVNSKKNSIIRIG